MNSFTRVCRRIGRGWSGDDAGSSLLEFSLMLPFLLGLFVGGVDFGRAWYTQMEVASAAEAGALYGLQNPGDTQGMQAAATLDAQDVPTLSSTATYGLECSDGTSVSVHATSTPTCSVNDVEYVQVTASVTYVPLINYPGFGSSDQSECYFAAEDSAMMNGLLLDEEGGTLTETAAVFLAFLMIFFGIIESARVMYADIYVGYSARLAADYAMVHGSTFAGQACVSPSSSNCVASATDVLNFVQAHVTPGISASALSVSSSWPGTNAAGSSCVTTNGTNSPGCVVQVQVSYNFNYVVPFFPTGTLALRGKSAVTIAQ